MEKKSPKSSPPSTITCSTQLPCLKMSNGAPAKIFTSSRVQLKVLSNSQFKMSYDSGFIASHCEKALENLFRLVFDT